jgi:serine protease Do
MARLEEVAVSDVLEAVSCGLAEAAGDARLGLVEVRDGRRGSGAGTIWHSDGLILTNAHVAGHRTVEVHLNDGRSLRATVAAYDPGLDLAALTVEAHDLPAIELGSSSRLRPGEIVVAVGHPWGVTGAATAGVVIGVGKDLGDVRFGERELIAVSLHLRPGHSGGALVDAHGRLVGINTMMAGPDVGLAVPVDVVKRFMRDALAVAQPERARAA